MILTHLPRSRLPSMLALVRRWAVRRLLKHLTNAWQRSTNTVLRRPVESAQYVSIKYTERLAEAGIEPSVGSVGDSYDNALAETINGLYKAEVIPARTLAPLRSRRLRHARIGRLVQP